MTLAADGQFAHVGHTSSMGTVTLMDVETGKRLLKQ
jgi:hypothetical protein